MSLVATPLMKVQCVRIMHLSILCPTFPPPRAVGGEGWGFDQAKIQIPTVWEDQIVKSPSIPVPGRRLGRIWSNQRSNSPPFPTHCPGWGEVGHTIDRHINNLNGGCLIQTLFSFLQESPFIFVLSSPSKAFFSVIRWFNLRRHIDHMPLQNVGLSVFEL